MAATNKKLCSGTLSNTNATLYTAPATAGNYAIIKTITLCNKTATAATATMKLDGVEIICTHTLLAYETITIPFLNQILEAGKLIEGSAGTASAIAYYVSGVEVA